MNEKITPGSLASDKPVSVSTSDETELGHLNQFNLQNIDILESITDAFAAFDGKWRFIYVNAAAERFLGAPRDEIIGKRHWDLFPHTLGTIVEENYRRAVAEQITIEFEFFYEHWNRWFSIRCYPAANGGLTNYFRDITEAKQAEQNLRLQNRALERANHLLEEFAYISSHDLQEPIRNIKIAAELLAEEAEDAGSGLNEAASQFVSLIQKSATILETLVRDLLVYSRVIPIDDGETVAQADLSDCYRQALEILQPTIQETGACIAAGPLPTVKGDALQLTHVFQNLLSNSLKYRRPDVKPVIRLSATLEDHWWTIAVEDNGIGFDARHAERIFGLFKRLHRECDYPGNGLGLAICRRVIERYGGRIWAEGKPNQGASFHLTLRDAGKMAQSSFTKTES